MKTSIPFHQVPSSVPESVRITCHSSLLAAAIALLSFIPCLLLAANPRPQFTCAPAPNPGVPSGTDPFTPDLGGSVGTQSGVFAEWTRQAIQGDTIAATGRFSSFSGNDAGRDVIFLAHGQNANGSALLPCKVQRLNGRYVALTLDPALPDGMFFVWPRNNYGIGYPAAINQTDAWWVGSSTATRGDTVAVYGRNLAQRSGTSTNCSAVYIKPSNSAGQWATLISVNPYKVEFTVPAGLANGTYEVWTHNKMGGTFGWSGPLALTINDGLAWSGSTYNVVSYGANGSDGNDDTTAIKNAMNAAALTPNSTVYLPAGTYYISSNIKAPANVRWLGDGAQSSVLQVTANGVKMFTVATANIEFRNLGMQLATTGSTKCINGAFNNLRLIDCAFSGTGDTSQNLIYLADGTGGLVVDNCLFTGPWPISTRNAKQMFIKNSDFYGSADCDLIDILGSDCSEIAVENCTGQDLDNTNVNGWCGGRFVKNMNGHRCMYIADCTTTQLGVRPGFSNQNQGEHVLWEQGYGSLLSTVVISTSNTVTLASDAITPKSNITIIDGQGVGQSRYIVSVSGSTATVTPPWNFPPDSTSTVAVHAAIDKAVVYRNHFDGKAAVTGTAANGSSAVNCCGSAMNVIIDQNTIVSTRNGIRTVAYGQLDVTPTYAMPSYFNVVQNNSLTSCRLGLLHGFGSASNPAFIAGVYSLGHVFRGNVIQSPVVDGFEISTGSWAQSSIVKPVEMLIYDNNELSSCPIGLSANLGTQPAGVGDFLVIDNSMSGSPNINFAAGQLPGLSGNVWNGVSYGGTLPGAILEVPYRRIPLSGTVNGPIVSGTLTIRNAGTSQLNWTMTSNSSWLTVSPASGSIADQTGQSSVAFSCNPAGLTSGLKCGILTVQSGTQTKTASVLFDVSQ